MKRQVSLYEAKTNLSQLVEDAARGDVIVIAKNGKPRAKLMLLETADTSPPQKRALGQWAHLADPHDKRTPEEWWRDWKAMDAEIERDFEESINRPIGEPIEPFPRPLQAGEASREFKWQDTSSTPTSSSGPKRKRPNSAGTRSRKSKKRKTHSS
jgi:prevent-host-death family protein